MLFSAVEEAINGDLSSGLYRERHSRLCSTLRSECPRSCRRLWGGVVLGYQYIMPRVATQCRFCIDGR